MIETGNRIDDFLQGPRDRDLHLVNRHDAVIDADDDSREVRGRKDGDGDIKSQIDAEQRQGRNDEQNGF